MYHTSLFVDLFGVHLSRKKQGKRLSGSRVTVTDSILRVLKCEKANSLVFAVFLPHLTQTSCDMGCAKGVPEKFVF